MHEAYELAHTRIVPVSEVKEEKNLRSSDQRPNTGSEPKQFMLLARIAIHVAQFNSIRESRRIMQRVQEPTQGSFV